MRVVSMSFQVKCDEPAPAHIAPQGKYPKSDANRKISVLKGSALGIDLVNSMRAKLKELPVSTNGEMPVWSDNGDFVSFAMGGGIVYEADYDPTIRCLNSTPTRLPLARLCRKSKIHILSITAHAEMYPAKLDEDKAVVYPAGVACKVDKMLIMREPEPVAEEPTAEDFGFTIAKKGNKRVTFQDAAPAGKSKKKSGHAARRLFKSAQALAHAVDSDGTEELDDSDCGSYC